ncbi:MAG TPA: Ig domain-containing protein [Acidimicrobiales bacterium]|nr:Ig domain-containing protein [Acidimicrobiales bacterium]
MASRGSRRIVLLIASLTTFTAAALAGLVVPQAADASTPVQITTTSLPGATVGQPYSAQIQVTGGTPPYKYTLTDTPEYPLPPGLSLGLTTGVISGTAGTPPVNQPTTYTFIVNVFDNGGIDSNPAQTELSITLTPPGYVPPPPLQITTTSIPDATYNTAYSFQMQATGGTGGYAWDAQNLPQGFTMSPSGVISGQNPLPEQSSITVTVTDSGTVYSDVGVQSSSQQTVTKGYTFTVTSGYPQLDPTLFELSSVLAQAQTSAYQVIGEVDYLLSLLTSPTAILGLLSQIGTELNNTVCSLYWQSGLGGLLNSPGPYCPPQIPLP